VGVEAGFASTLGLHVGDRLDLGGATFRVVGTAVTAAIPAYPDTCSHAQGCVLANAVASHKPGLVWATQADTKHIAGTFGPDVYLLLALLALASVAVLVGGRMAEQTRRVGLLKAVGGTPRLVAVVLLFEHAPVGLCAAGVGLLVGWLAGPLIDGPGAGLPDAASAPSVSGATVASVVAVAFGVAIVATFVPAIRAARQHGRSTQRFGPGATESRIGDQALGAPAGTAAPRRAASSSPATTTPAERLQYRCHRERARRRADPPCDLSRLVSRSPGDPGDHHHLGHAHRPGRCQRNLHRLDDAARNAHPAALARALGATPEQITTGLCVAQLLPAFFGALLGIPGGIVIYDAPKNGRGPTALPSARSLVAMVVATMLVIAVLTAVPTRMGARRPVAEVLHAEAA